MRQQNPPSTHIKKAEEFEKYLRPGTLACLYGAIAVLCDSVIALVFAGLVLGSVLNPTSLTITIAAVVGCVPLLSALAAYWRRPHDPLSYYLGGLAKEWRRPLEVSGDECMFKTNIRTGDEMLLVKLRFQYPLKYQTLEIKERLYTHTHAALTSEFSMTYSLPGFSDVERALGPSVETLAAEYDIPVLFTEVLDIRKMRVVYDFADPKERSSQPVYSQDDEYLATGTNG